MTHASLALAAGMALVWVLALMVVVRPKAELPRRQARASHH